MTVAPDRRRACRPKSPREFRRKRVGQVQLWSESTFVTYINSRYPVHCSFLRRERRARQKLPLARYRGHDAGSGCDLVNEAAERRLPRRSSDIEVGDSLHRVPDATRECGQLLDCGSRPHHTC